MANNLNIPLNTDDLKAELARRHHSGFMSFLWREPQKFLVGYHTKIICDRIDKALAEYREGISTFLSIKVPFRHGKSHIVSRFLPPRFLGMFPDDDVIVTAHTASLVKQFSRYAKAIMDDERYHLCYPEVFLSSTEASVDSWGIEGRMGRCTWVGLDGSITGKGGKLIVIDDFFKNREDAESESTREKVWIKILHDVLTRRGDPSIVIILATPWHVDDPFGRISNAMEADSTFPHFEEIKFPYKHPDYPKRYLFPERYSAHWYESQASMLGPYGRASLMECDPQLRQGNMLRVDKIKVLDTFPPDLTYSRGWDLASSTKQRMRDNPDYTVGLKIGCRWTPSAVPGQDVAEIYVDDMIRGRWEAAQRDRMVVNATVADGPIPMGAEAFGPYKDAYTTLVKILFGIRTVHKCNLPGDKAAKYQVLEPIFSAGNVYIKKADWNTVFLEEISRAPSGGSGVKDDIPDALTVAFETLQPYHKRLIDRFDGGPQFERLRIPWNNLHSPVRYVVSIWVDEDQRANLLLGMWYEYHNRLWILMERVFDNPRPEGILPVVAYLVRGYTMGKVQNVIEFDWLGSQNMFSETKNDMQSVYRKYNIWLRTNRRFDEDGAVLMVNRLIKRRRLSLDETVQETLIQVNNWCMVENRADKGYGLAKSLANMVSFIDESGYARESGAPFGDTYTQKRTDMQERAQRFVQDGRPDEFEPLNVATPETAYDWMKA